MTQLIFNQTASALPLLQWRQGLPRPADSLPLSTINPPTITRISFLNPHSPTPSLPRRRRLHLPHLQPLPPQSSALLLE